MLRASWPMPMMKKKDVKMERRAANMGVEFGSALAVWKMETARKRVARKVWAREAFDEDL